ncbi:hypothetical protein [Streptomyces sp. URMC 123]|uniref:hypothetical protein n=1 Tax=Streptomyces sp. URMC 123 TaxID=3423403 RepID=UPI003F1E0C9C
MIAVARYALADFLRSQRFLPPLVAFLGLQAILHASSPGPALSAYGLSCAALLPVAVWTTLALHRTEDPLQTTVTVVNARGHRRALTGTTGAAVAGPLVLSVIGLAWPMVAHARLYAPADVAIGLAAHLICGITGVALGTCCARPVIGRQGYAFAAASLLALTALVARPLTPANRTIRLLSAAPPRPPTGELLVLAAWAFLMLLASVALATWVARRRR